ncbi:hypothetical protein KUTeg_017441 [Tegillarca granosa]|uniref:Cytochrome P450 n=1 Tax=Tegillarca granosa TaxID=220873 RepID=A0ABQ9EEX8_TEGGR|nr:hypothetical protein KUTeg_017441 [Tegillarca granosa]
MDNIASTAFGLEIDSQKNPNDPFVKHAKMLFSWTFADFVMILVCLTRTEIHGNTIVFMVAGYETTKITLTFAAYTLATNPDVQEKLIQEIDRELADQELGYENVMNLEYLDMFLSEVLRLWGPAPRINRVAATDITLNGIKIPRGADVTISPVVVHRDPEYWPNPDKFDPERRQQAQW